jgi:hypothetical protein
MPFVELVDVRSESTTSIQLTIITQPRDPRNATRRLLARSGIKLCCIAGFACLHRRTSWPLRLLITWWVYYCTELYDDTDMSCTIVSRGYRPFRQVTAKIAGAGVSQGKAVDLESIDVPASIPMCSAVKLTS